MKTLILMIIIFLNLTAAFAGQWKFRAREHFEVHEVYQGINDSKFKGLSQTLNFWYEKPLNYSIGLAVGPLIGSAKNTGKQRDLLYGDRMRLYNVGVEGKYFFLKFLEGLFFRGGVGWSRFESKGSMGSLQGYNFYTGLGYEFYVTKSFTVAAEFAFRKTYVSKGVRVKTITPSLGVHFYQYF